MKRRNVDGRLERLEADVERFKPDPRLMSDEERYYRIQLLYEKARARIRSGWKPTEHPTEQSDPEESRRRKADFERMRPRLEAAEQRINAEAERLGLTQEEYLRKRFWWVE